VIATDPAITAPETGPDVDVNLHARRYGGAGPSPFGAPVWPAPPWNCDQAGAEDACTTEGEPTPKRTTTIVHATA
jgi:hypothetical protein